MPIFPKRPMKRQKHHVKRAQLVDIANKIRHAVALDHDFGRLVAIAREMRKDLLAGFERDLMLVGWAATEDGDFFLHSTIEA